MDDLLAAGYLLMPDGRKTVLDFYTSPQPTDYVKKERKKKPATDDGSTAADPVSMDAAPPVPPVYEEEEYQGRYRSSSTYSPYGWDEN